MRPLDATAGDDGCRPSAGRRCVAGTAAVLGTMGAMARAGLKDALLFGAAALGPLALYVATLPRTVVLEDDGLFLMAGASLGVAHPPGYPLYTLVCHLFMQLPFATPAVSGHLSSAVPGALACAMVAVCARQLGASRCAALAGAWLLGASEHFWSQAIIAEVYTLNALLFFGVYALLLRVVLRPDTDTGSSAPSASPGTTSPEPERRRRRRDRRRRRGRGRDRDRDRDRDRGGDRSTSSMAASPGPEGPGPDAGGATARAGIVAGRNGASAGRVGMAAGRNGAFAGRAGIAVERNGGSAGRAGIVAERSGASAGRAGIVAERNGASAGRAGIVAERNGASAGRNGMAAERNGVSAGRAGIVAERSGASAGRNGIVAERSGASAGRAGIVAGRNEASAGRVGIAAERNGASAGRAGIAAERNGASAGRNGIAAGRAGIAAGRNEASAGRAGIAAERNGASAGRAGIVAGRNGGSAGRAGIAAGRNGASAGRVGIAAAVLYGLGLANHWPLMVLATPGLVIAALPGWRALRPGLLPCAGAALAGAVLPYAWMVWRSRQEPWFSFHGPLESMREIWHYIGRRSYAGVDTSVSADWSDRIQYLLWFGNETLWQLTLPGFVLAAIGLVVLLHRNPPEGEIGPHPQRDPPDGGTGPHPQRDPPEGGTGPRPRRDPPEGGAGPHPRRVPPEGRTGPHPRLNPPEGGTGPHPRRRDTRLAAAGGALAWLGNSVVLIGLLSFDFDAFSVSVFRPYSLVCYGLAAVWLAVGLQHLLDTVPKWMGRAAPAHGERAHGPRKGWKPAAALFALVRDRHPRRDARPWKGWKPAAALLAGAGMTALAVHAHGPLNDRSGSDFTSLYARMTLDTLPPDAVLFTSGDTDTAPLGYFRLVEGRRTDVELLNTQGLVFGRRLFDWRAREAERDAAIREFVLASERPVFFTSERKPSPGLGVRYHGFLTELVPGGAAIELQLDPRQPRLFEELMRHASRDPWERSRRAQLISTFGKYLGLAVLTGDPGLLERLGPSIAQAEGSFFGLIGMADTLMEHGDPAHHGRIEDLLGRAEHLAGEAEYPEPLARFAYLKGFLRHRLGDPAAARALFEESARIHPHPDNASLGALEQLRSGS